MKKWLKLTMVMVAVLFIFYLFFQQWITGIELDQGIIYEHYAVFLCIPTAAFAALILVIIFDETYGQIKLSFWQFKFEGAAAPLTMWIVCFLSIVLAIKLLW